MSIQLYKTVILSLCGVLIYWPMGTQSICPPYARLTCPRYKDTSSPDNGKFIYCM